MKKFESPRCPSCGAAVAADLAAGSVPCAYCKAVLHPLRCPWCLAWAFSESPDCAACGSTPVANDEPPGDCPECRVPLVRREHRKVLLCGCAQRGGAWFDPLSLSKLCGVLAEDASLLDGPSAPPVKTAAPSKRKVSYRPCPACAELMNRVNFSGASGIVVDACRLHGTWFDPEELGQLADYIRSGGLHRHR